MLARGLTTMSIQNACRTVERFQEYTNDYPWRWRPQQVDEYFADRRSNTDSPLALSTLRAYSSSIRMFCAYLSDGRYGWAALCERMFGDVPSQVVFEWNSPRHTTDDAMPPGRRAFTQIEMQTFFDAADDLVDREFAAGSKRWLSALRDSTAFKIAYAYGLRRRELAMLSSTDFGPNPHVPDYRSFGAVQVRWAKGTAGSGPRRRTVLTVPKFEWVVDLLEFWLSADGRGRFPMSARSSDLWPSERSPRASLRAFEYSCGRFRSLAGLPTELSLHALRHSYVTHLIEDGYDPLFVQQQVGHAYSSTTALYTSVSADFKQKTVQRMIAARIKRKDPDG